MQNKYFKFLIIALAVAIVVPQVALAAWWNPMSWNWGRLNSIFHFQQTAQKQNSPSQQAPGQIKKTTDQTVGWKTYTNNDYGFEIKYPQDFKTTVSSTYGGLLDLTFGFSNTPYIGDLSLSVDKNDKNETVVQYFARKKLEAAQGFASKCQTCANMDVDAELFGCFADEANVIKIAGKDGYTCKNMPKKATYYSPIYIFNNGYIYRFTGYSREMPNYKIYSQILSTFKFTNTQPVVGGDKDAHGCIGSAGYSWCEAKQKCLRSWEEKCETTIKQAPSIGLISSGEDVTWKIGTTHTIQYNTSEIGPAGTCVDAFLINQDNVKATLSLGSYIHLTGVGSYNGVEWQGNGITFTLNPNIGTGRYKIELDAHYCAETNNAFITSGTSANYFTITK